MPGTATPSGPGPGAGSGNRSRRGRGRRRSTTARGNSARPKTEGSNNRAVKRDYLPSEEELAEDEALADDYDDKECIYVQHLKAKTPQELTVIAEEMAVENAAGMRKQDLLFSILQAQTKKSRSC